MKIHIVGAGMSGLLAANVLRRHDVTVFERSPRLPDNHGALLRFGSPAVSDATGIPFRKVTVQKWVEGGYSPIVASNLYSQKVTGSISARSILNTDGGDRWIAPKSFLQQLASGLRIRFGIDYFNHPVGEEPDIVISTISLPDLLGSHNYLHSDITFAYKSIATLSCDIVNPPIDVFQSVYIPKLEDPVYRASITGNRLILEGSFVPEVIEFGADGLLVDYAERFFGIEGFAADENVSFKQHRYGKILPIDEVARQQLLYKFTSKHGIFSLGRYATWRPGLQLCDLIKDIMKIENWAINGMYK